MTALFLGRGVVMDRVEFYHALDDFLYYNPELREMEIVAVFYDCGCAPQRDSRHYVEGQSGGCWKAVGRLGGAEYLFSENGNRIRMVKVR